MRIFFVVCCVLLGTSSSGFAEEFLTDGAPSFDGAKATTTLPHFEVLARVLSPSVVNISVETEMDEQDGSGLPPGFPFFKGQPGTPGRSLGSGFIISPDGYIATNYHVVQKAERIIIRLLDDRREYEGKLVGKDEKTDLALLKIDVEQELPPAFIGNSDDLAVGEWVMAIGNQFQLGQTVTAGIVSAKSRKVRSKTTGPYDDFIQTDASINPGSSGGPLFNARGQVIGINTAIFSPGRNQFGGTGFNIGIGFAIPINMAKDILRQLKESGRVTRGLLGVIIQNIDGDMAQALGLKNAQGALVAEVVAGSPAARAGFEQKDVILEYDGQPVEDHDDLPLMVASTPLGSEVAVKINRGGNVRTLTPKIVELKEDFFAPMEALDAEETPNELGILVEELNQILARSLKLGSAEGLIVTAVEAGSPAHQAGITVGDVLLELDSIKLKDKGDLAKAIEGMKDERAALLLVKTKVKGQVASRFLTIKLSDEEVAPEEPQ